MDPKGSGPPHLPVVFGRRLSDDEVYSPDLPAMLAEAYSRATPVFRFLSSLAD